jgi:hypothetical protein
MGYARYISRVGALAVALGIGAGLAATPWVAWAKPPDSGSPGPSVSASADGQTGEQKSPGVSSPDGNDSVGTADGENNSATATGSDDNHERANGDNSDASTVTGDTNTATTTAVGGKTIKGSGTGTINIDTATGALTGEESGVSSHLGKYTLDLQGVSTQSPDGTVNSSGTVTIVTANGDQLTGTFTLTGREPTLTAVVTITGGTGRFTNATGTLTVICVPSGTSQGEPVLVIKHDCTTDGEISY